ncbi:TPR repeat-containing protein [Planctopirus limnophila DSM 3776]|uniref:TPR repeat-containing protein n=2 Tax=Planctopirus limnophila TaxID=120 RepID=D5SP39_PLAL2|nr:TPR repeat-containing protein [Planctopirus limnophila DSM 3776]
MFSNECQVGNAIMQRALGLVVVIALLADAHSTRAEEIREGTRVVVIAEKSELQVSGKPAGTVPECSIFTVGKVSPPWLWIPSQQAYLLQRDVIPFTDAIDHYTRQIAANPTANAYWNRAQIWRMKGELDIALADMNEAIQRSPGVDAWHNNRGLLWRNKGNEEQAISDFNEAIRLNPKIFQAYSNRGNSWRLKGELDKALADYTEALRLTPTSERIKVLNSDERTGGDSSQLTDSRAETYFARGYTWEAKGDLDQAMADYNEAIRLNPRNIHAYYSRGASHFVQGHSKALTDCDKLLELEKGVGEYSAYAIILGNLAARRVDQPAAAAKFLASASKLKNEWPQPIVRYLQRELTADELLQLAVDQDKRTDAECYIGLDALLDNRPDEARTRFQWVDDNGTKTFVAYDMARHELRKLDGSQSKPSP